MSRNQFRAARLTPAEATDLWNRSDDASAFTRPDYLEHIVDEVEWWGVDRGGEIVAAWPLVRAVAGGEIGPPPFCYYLGPMFARSLRDDKYSRSWTAFTDCFSALVTGVVSEHPRFRFTLPIGQTDVRVLAWWNFDHPEDPGFRMTPRYTARIDLSEFPDDDSLRLSMASDRRRHVNRWMPAPPLVVDRVPIERIIELHDEALERDGATSHPGRHSALRRLVDFAQTGGGAVFGLVPPDSDQVEAAVILLDGPNESNGVFCIASSPWRDKGLIAWANWLSLLKTRDLGRRWFDFNGANSPGRAADKHLYSAKTQLYFDCSFGLYQG